MQFDKLQAGDLKHKIIIQYDASDGTEDQDWQPLITVQRNGAEAHDIAAAKLGLIGRMYYAAAAVQSENDVTLIVRYNQQTLKIRPTMRVLLDRDTDSPYKITSDPVDPDGRRKWLEIHARRTSQNGR